MLETKSEDLRGLVIFGTVVTAVIAAAFGALITVVCLWMMGA